MLVLVVAGLATTTCFVASVVAAVSVGSKTTKPASGFSILLLAAWIDLPFTMLAIGPRLIPGVHAWIWPMNRVLLDSGPMSVAAHLTGMIAGGSLTEVMLRMIAYEAVGCLLLTAWAVARLRPASRGLDGAGDAPKRVLGRSAGSRRPPCGDAPMMWKDLYIERGGVLARVASAITYGLLFVVLVGTLAVIAKPAWAEMLAEGHGATGPGGARRQFNQVFVRPLSAGLMFFLVLLVGAMTGESLELERKRDTWSVLLARLLFAHCASS